MSRTDRAVQRALRNLVQGETLIASAVGYENEGRRRQIVLLTDRRVVVAGLRDDSPVVEFAPAVTAATFDPYGARLIFRQDKQPELVVRDVEMAAARQIVTLLEDRRVLPDSALAPRVRHVQIQPHGSDKTDS